MSGGLLQMSGVVVDLVHRIDRLPARGEEVEATSAFVAAGGGFNAMAAAKRLGAAVAYGGALGVGVFADMVVAALAAEGVPALQTRRAAIDQGTCVALVDRDGERSFVSHHGAERRLAPEALAAIDAAAYDWVLLSGYSLYVAESAEAMIPWLAALPRGPQFLFDPGPVAADTPKPRLAAALARADWISANRREAEALTGLADPARAAQALAKGRAGALVREGARGCRLSLAGEAAETIPGFAVEALDTTGAGDTHDGAFVAAMLAGAAPREAARFANAAAALSVTRLGPATAPTRAEVLAFLAARRGGATARPAEPMKPLGASMRRVSKRREGEKP